MSLAGTVVLARILTPEDFGVVAMVVPLVILANGMGNVGFQTALIQSAELEQARTSDFFRFALRANLAIAAAFVAASALLAWFYDEPRVVPLSAAWAALVCLVTLTNFQEGLLKREMRFPAVVAVQLAGLVVGVLAAIAAAGLGARHWSFLAQAVVVEVVRAASVALLSGWRPSPAKSPDVDHSGPLRAFWWSMAGFRATSWASEQPDRILVGRLGGAGTLGLYDTAHRWSWYAFLEPFIALTDLAVASLSRVRGDAARYRLFFARETRAILTVALPIMTFVAVEPASVVRVLLGPQWGAAVPFVRLVAIAAIFGSAGRLAQWVHFSAGTGRRLLRWWLLVQTPVLLVAVLVGARFGARGVAIGYTVATAALAFPALLWGIAGTPIRFGDFARAAARPALASIGAALALLAAAPILPPQAGASRLLAALPLFAACFLLTWLATPGGPAAARELVVAIREVVPGTRR